MQYGVIEGFYGKPWSFDDRHDLISFFKEQGFSFYYYAPKADIYLREQWQQAHPQEASQKLTNFGKALKKNDLDFGVGLSPYGLQNDWNKDSQKQLKNKLCSLEKLGITTLALLFDDINGANDSTAQIQIDISHFVFEHYQCKKLVVCPSYYSFDPKLETVFGQMPEKYLQTFGEELDPKIDIFWTGPEVCSKHFSRSHIQEINHLLQRKVFIWDNYPVNDGKRMSQFLHLSPFIGRNALSKDNICAYASNPMNQAYLSTIPLFTLAKLFKQRDHYDSHQVWQQSLKCLPKLLAKQIQIDLKLFETVGLNQISQEKKEKLIKRYKEINSVEASKYCQEVIDYLKGLSQQNNNLDIDEANI